MVKQWQWWLVFVLLRVDFVLLWEMNVKFGTLAQFHGSEMSTRCQLKIKYFGLCLV